MLDCFISIILRCAFIHVNKLSSHLLYLTILICMHCVDIVRFCNFLKDDEHIFLAPVKQCCRYTYYNISFTFFNQHLYNTQFMNKRALMRYLTNRYLSLYKFILVSIYTNISTCKSEYYNYVQ